MQRARCWKRRSAGRTRRGWSARSGTATTSPPPWSPSRPRNGAGRLHGIAVLSHLVAPPGCLALGPLAVAGGRRDRGIGQALIAESIGWARRAGHAAIFVLGQPRYYGRFGFSVEAARPFASPYPADYMMALELRPGALAGGGELRYPAAFAALG